MDLFSKLIGKRPPKNMFDLGGYTAFRIGSFLYNNNNYVPKSGYGFIFHPVFRLLGQARRPSQLGVPNKWTKYKRNCPICKKETECLVIGIIFMKDLLTATQNTYLDYCTGCSNVLTLIEIKDNKMGDGEAVVLLMLELNTSSIPLPSIPKNSIKTATEYQKARFEIFLKNFASRSNTTSKSSQETLATSIEEVKKAFYPNM